MPQGFWSQEIPSEFRKEVLSCCPGLRPGVLNSPTVLLADMMQKMCNLKLSMGSGVIETFRHWDANRCQ